MAILAEKPTGLDRLPVPKHFDIAIPSQALTQRPDLRAAERRLAAASADIGLAEADRYPRLSLNGSLGYSTTGTSSARKAAGGVRAGRAPRTGIGGIGPMAVVNGETVDPTPTANPGPMIHDAAHTTSTVSMASCARVSTAPPSTPVCSDS